MSLIFTFRSCEPRSAPAMSLSRSAALSQLCQDRSPIPMLVAPRPSRVFLRQAEISRAAARRQSPVRDLSADRRRQSAEPSVWSLRARRPRTISRSLTGEPETVRLRSSWRSGKSRNIPPANCTACWRRSMKIPEDTSRRCATFNSRLSRSPATSSIILTWAPNTSRTSLSALRSRCSASPAGNFPVHRGSSSV